MIYIKEKNKEHKVQRGRERGRVRELQGDRVRKIWER